MGYIFTYADLSKRIPRSEWKWLIDPTFKEPTNDDILRIDAKLSMLEYTWYDSYYWHRDNVFPFLRSEDITVFNRQHRPTLDVEFRTQWPKQRRAVRNYVEWPKFAWDACTTGATFSNRIRTNEDNFAGITSNRIYGWYRQKEQKPDLRNPEEATYLQLISEYGKANYILSRNLLMRYDYEGTMAKEVKK